jgi:hypothetical protein
MSAVLAGVASRTFVLRASFESAGVGVSRALSVRGAARGERAGAGGESFAESHGSHVRDGQRDRAAGPDRNFTRLSCRIPRRCA